MNTYTCKFVVQTLQAVGTQWTQRCVLPLCLLQISTVMVPYWAPPRIYFLLSHTSPVMWHLDPSVQILLKYADPLWNIKPPPLPWCKHISRCKDVRYKRNIAATGQTSIQEQKHSAAAIIKKNTLQAGSSNNYHIDHRSMMKKHLVQPRQWPGQGLEDITAGSLSKIVSQPSAKFTCSVCLNFDWAIVHSA